MGLNLEKRFTISQGPSCKVSCFCSRCAANSWPAPWSKRQCVLTKHPMSRHSEDHSHTPLTMLRRDRGERVHQSNEVSLGSKRVGQRAWASPCSLVSLQIARTEPVCQHLVRRWAPTACSIPSLHPESLDSWLLRSRSFLGSLPAGAIVQRFAQREISRVSGRFPEQIPPEVGVAVVFYSHPSSILQKMPTSQHSDLYSS